jgi:hypothetical protein
MLLRTVDLIGPELSHFRILEEIGAHPNILRKYKNNIVRAMRAVSRKCAASAC